MKKTKEAAAVAAKEAQAVRACLGFFVGADIFGSLEGICWGRRFVVGGFVWFSPVFFCALVLGDM